MGRRGRDVETSGEVQRHKDVKTLSLWSHTHAWWIKIGRDTSEVRDPSPTPDYPAQSSSARKISPHNF